LDFSPDMTWLAYTSNESGPYEVYALRLDGSSRTVRVSSGGGETPRWSPRGDGLFYRNGRRFYWVPLTGSSEEPFGTPELFLTGSFNNVAGPEVGVSADGSALLLLLADGDPQTATLDLVENFRGTLIERLGPAPRR
jgi:hypothetical protein